VHVEPGVAAGEAPFQERRVQCDGMAHRQPLEAGAERGGEPERTLGGRVGELGQSDVQ
jgi:hypothetical protein